MKKYYFLTINIFSDDFQKFLPWNILQIFLNDALFRKNHFKNSCEVLWVWKITLPNRTIWKLILYILVHSNFQAIHSTRVLYEPSMRILLAIFYSFWEQTEYHFLSSNHTWEVSHSLGSMSSIIILMNGTLLAGICSSSYSLIAA